MACVLPGLGEDDGERVVSDGKPTGTADSKIAALREAGTLG